jgi:hypothetical protein
MSGVDLELVPTPLGTLLAPLVKLQSLELVECGVDSRQLQLLMRAPFSANLRSLVLSENHKMAEGFVMCVQTCTGLTSLTLGGGTSWELEEDDVACARALAYGALHHLQVLNFAGWKISEEAACHLACGAWNQLSQLHLGGTCLSAPAVTALMKAGWWGNLVRLHMVDGLADNAGVQEFAKGHFENLTYLDFGVWEDRNDDPLHAMPVFQSAAAFPKLRALHMAMAIVTEERAAALSMAPWNLCSLKLRECRLGDSGLLALAQGNILRGLTELDISGEFFTADGLLSFADAATGKCKSIEVLEIGASDEYRWDHACPSNPAAAERIVLMALRAG